MNLHFFESNPETRKKVETIISACFDKMRDELPSEDFHLLLFVIVYKQIIQSGKNFKQILSDLDQMEMVCQNNSVGFKEDLYQVYLIYNPILLKLSEENRLSIGEDLMQLEVYSEFALGEIFDLIFHTLSRLPGRSKPEIPFPQDLADFINQIFELPYNSSVYNPYSGVGAFGAIQKEGIDYLGQEVNNISWAISWLRLFSNEKLRDNGSYCKCVVKQENPIMDWNSKGESYDLIISNPPMGMRVDPFKIGEPKRSRTCEHFVIENGLKSLKPGGKLIAVVSNGYLYGSGIERDLRRKLIENDLLEAIVTFPSGLLEQTNIPFALIVLNTEKATKGFVRFIDATGFSEVRKKGKTTLDTATLLRVIKGTYPSEFSKLVPNQQVGQTNYNLSAPRYFQDEIEGTRIDAVARILKGTKSEKGELGRIVKIRDLANDSIKFQLKLENLEVRIIPPNFSKISQTCVLVATGWNSLKPTFFEFNGESIFISKDILALTIDENSIDTFYFLSQLNSPEVKFQANKYREGITVTHLRTEDLQRIKIQVPSLEKQREITRRNFQYTTEHLEEGIGMFVKEAGLQYEVQNAFLRHSLAGPVANMRGTVESILEIMNHQVLQRNQEFSHLKVSENHLFTLKEYLEMLDRDSTIIADLVSRNMQKTLDFSSKELSPIDLYSFVKQYAEELKETKKGKYEIVFDHEILVDEDGNSISITIQGNRELLTLLLDNLVENAETHAFQNGTPNRIDFIILEPNSFTDVPETTILVSNTGTPFPEDFPWKTFGVKGASAGPKAGNGLGGWIINEVMKFHKGRWDFIDESGPEGFEDDDSATSFELIFPVFEIQKLNEI